MLKVQFTLSVPPTLSSPDDIKHISDLFDQFGPIPRLCIDYLARDSDSDSNSWGMPALARYEMDVQKIIASLNLSKFEQLIEHSRFLTMDGDSDMLLLISREDRKCVFSSAIVSPISSTIKSRLANHFRTLLEQHNSELTRLYYYYSKTSDLKAISGIFFEDGGLQDGLVS